MQRLLSTNLLTKTKTTLFRTNLSLHQPPRFLTRRLLTTLDSTTTDVPLSLRSKLVRWSEEEDRSLTALVAEHGTSSWAMISSLLAGGTRNGKQCHQRWTKALDPSVTKGEWSEDEDTSLTALVAEHGTSSWAMISSQLAGGTRTDAQCRIRWTFSIDPSINFGDWSEDETSILLSEYSNTPGKWAAIAKALLGRTGPLVRQQYMAIT